MLNLLGDKMKHPDESRSLLRALYKSDTDLLSDENGEILTVRLHHMTNQCSDAVVEKLCEELNATKTKFPGTNLRLEMKLSLKQNRRGDVI